MFDFNILTNILIIILIKPQNKGSNIIVQLQNGDLPMIADRTGNSKNIQMITWETEGDYHPYVIFPYATNGSELAVTFPDYIIHVKSSDSLIEGDRARINYWLAIVLFILTIIMAIPIINEWGHKLLSDLGDLKKSPK